MLLAGQWAHQKAAVRPGGPGVVAALALKRRQKDRELASNEDHEPQRLSCVLLRSCGAANWLETAARASHWSTRSSAGPRGLVEEQAWKTWSSLKGA